MSYMVDGIIRYVVVCIESECVPDLHMLLLSVHMQCLLILVLAFLYCFYSLHSFVDHQVLYCKCNVCVCVCVCIFMCVCV